MGKSVFNAFPNHLNIITNLQILMLIKILSLHIENLNCPLKHFTQLLQSAKRGKRTEIKILRCPHRNYQHTSFNTPRAQIALHPPITKSHFSQNKDYNSLQK